MNNEELEPKESTEQEATQITAEEKTNELSASEQTNSSDESLKAEIAELKDKYLRLYSEFDNFRKRTAKEKLDLVQTANKDLFNAIIPVIDDFERARKSFEGQAEKDAKAIEEGMELIYHKMLRLLEQKGLKRMPSSIGKEFDMDFHEAITQVPAPSEEMRGKVIDEIEPGYMIGEKVIRFAKVVVGL